jgi:hypothetical protein
MNKFIRFLTLQKYRWDLAVSFLVFINFALLVVTASDKVQAGFSKIVGFRVDIFTVSLGLVFVSFLIILIAGYILDKKIRYTQHMASISNERNPEITEILENTRLLRQEIERLKHGSCCKEQKD